MSPVLLAEECLEGSMCGACLDCRGRGLEVQRFTVQRAAGLGSRRYCCIIYRMKQGGKRRL